MGNVLKNLLLINLILVGACKSPRGDDNYSELAAATSPYNAALQQASDEAQGLQLKNIPAERELTNVLQLDSKNWSSFQKLRNGHKILMFLKDPNITEDDVRTKPRLGQTAANSQYQPPIDSTLFYTAPVEYAFNAKLLVKCADMRRANFGFNELHKEYFTLSEEELKSGMYCGVIKFTQVGSRPGNRTNGDPSQVNIYLDSQYRPYGQDLEIFINRRDTQMTSHRLDPMYSVTSRMDLVPYDVPNLYALSRLIASPHSGNPSSKTIDRVALPGDAYVQDQLAKRNIQLCHGVKAQELQYNERFGMGAQRVVWCQKDAWPSIVENNQFLSVLVAKSN